MRLAPPQPSHHLKVDFPWDRSHQPFQTGGPLHGHRVIRRATRFSLHSAKVARFHSLPLVVYYTHLCEDNDHIGWLHFIVVQHFISIDQNSPKLF